CARPMADPAVTVPMVTQVPPVRTSSSEHPRRRWRPGRSRSRWCGLPRRRRGHFNLVKMTVHELSRDDARRIAVRAQALGSARPGGLLEVVRRLTLLQIDPVAAIAPN